MEMSVGRPRQNRLTPLAVLGCTGVALLFAPSAFTPAPVQPPSASQPRLSGEGGSAIPQAAAEGVGSAWTHLALGGAFLAFGAAAGLKRGVRRAAAAVTLRAQRGQKGGKKAKGGDEKRSIKNASDFDGAANSGQYSFMKMLQDEDEKEEEDIAEAIEQENMELELTADNIGEVEVEELSAEEAARRGERQVSYNLFPSRKYVSYIAKKNAERAWTKDGPDGVNKGCIEVQIAIITERIRNMVLHSRENIHDYSCRLKLVSLVARRRRLMDKLSWQDIDSYLKIRDELKIRHVYRMEALIGRLPEYKYAIRNRKRAPGRKVAMRLKKSQRLLQRRLATQIRQGKPHSTIHKTKQKIDARRWASREYDEANALRSGREVPKLIDPLDIP